MSDVAFHVRLGWHTVIRKLRTALQGPPTHPDFIRAAHYFSDGWALNLWQVVNPASILSELGTIRDDGFNTVILVFPWRGFQTDQLCPAYDPFYERQLHRVLSAADRLNMSVIVRVAYTYQLAVSDNLSGITQAQRLLTDDETRQAWLDYLGRLYRICHSHRSFRQGFVSWEEFWHAFGSWQLRNARPRRELAVTTGYLDYLSRQGIEAIEEIPQPGDPGHASFHAFTNHRIRELYEMALEVFPGLSMEFRVDKERLETDDGVQWVSNDDYADHSELRYTYWAPFMGAENKGETLGAGEAADLLSHMLDEVSYQGSQPGHVVDQFNFVDEAPKFKGIHAEIKEDEVPDFLQLAVPLLREMSRGYGVWAYRDYRQNILFNARFLMGMRGWQVIQGKARPRRRGGIRIGRGGVLRQFLPPTVSGLQRGVGFESLTLAVAMDGKASEAGLQARINAGPWVAPSAGAHARELLCEIPADFGAVMADGLLLELRNNGRRLDIDAMSLYHWVFRGGIRDYEGQESTYYAAVVAFNQSLDDYHEGAWKDQIGRHNPGTLI